MMWVPNQINLPRKLGQSKRDMQTSLIRRKSFNMCKMFSNVLKKFSKVFTKSRNNIYQPYVCFLCLALRGHYYTMRKSVGCQDKHSVSDRKGTGRAVCNKVNPCIM